MLERIYDVTGMSCAACSARVKRTMDRLEGVSYCEVNLLTEKMTLRYDENTLNFAAIQSAIEKAGYGVREPEREDRRSAAEAEEKERKTSFRRLVVAAVCAFPVFLLNISHMLPMITLPLPALLQTYPILNALIQLVLASVVLWCGRSFFIRGYRSLFSGSPNMDTLVAIGATAAMLESLYAAVRIALGNPMYLHRLYCESAAVVITLVMLGRYLEERAKRRTGDALRALEALRPNLAHVVRDGGVFDIEASRLCVGDEIEIRPGEAVPADAVVLEGHTGIDESMLTGESMPVEKSEGSEVIGGSQNLDGAIRARVTAEAGESVLARIIQLVEDAQSRQAPVARLADKVAGIFVPVVMALAVLAAIVWAIAGENADFCINVAIGVLVVACPCALGLATPASVMTGTGRSAALGVLFKSGEALERLSGIRTVVFDKTGTLTLGKPGLTDVIPYGISREEALSLCAAAEMRSEHPVGRAICDAAADVARHEVTAFTALPGRGVEAKVDGVLLLAGTRSLMEERGIDISAAAADENRLYTEGKTVVYAAREGKLFALFAAADALRPESRALVARLTEMGIQSYMLTGDNRMAAYAAAKQCGIPESRVIAGVLPGKKAETVAGLRRENPTAMVGDGINDAPALTEADIGIAVSGEGRGRAADIAVDAADVVLMRGELGQVYDAIQLSRASMRNIRENLFWAFAYNTVCIPAAAGVFYALGGGLLNPVWAGAAMALSSICVVSNALRLRWYTPKPLNGGKRR